MLKTTLRSAIATVPLLVQIAGASQPLETETARPLPAGWLKAESALEFQTSSDGKEYALPLAFEYGITSRLNLLVEPVVFTAIRPSHGENATGVGDLEATLSYLLVDEQTFVPAISPEFEIKLPTAKNNQIGTGETDYRGFVALSKRFGDLDTHANFGYTIVGSPSGTDLGNIFDYAVAAEYTLTPTVDVVAEVLGNTSSASGGDAPETVTPPATNTLPPEATATEVSGLLGARYQFEPGLFASLGVSYDNKDAVLIRLGLTYEFDFYKILYFGS